MKAAAIERQWSISTAPISERDQLAQTLDVPPLVAHLLLTRGIAEPDAARSFLNPSLADCLPDPNSLAGMDIAVERIRRASQNNERVLVFGDYDVDGIAGTALLYQGLQNIGIENCHYALPSRFTDGYGINAARVEEAKAAGADLIVTVDNGITAFDAAERARALGIDLIITDHHEPGPEIPDAHAVVNPKRTPTSPSLESVCGAAVGWCVLQALGAPATGLDLVALATVADVMPLTGLNRALVAEGLRVLATNPRPGVKALAQVARIPLHDIRAENIAFHLAPRLNAGGRIDDGAIGLELLLTSDEEEARALARRLNSLNEERRSIERDIYDTCLREIDPATATEERAIVLAGEAWHPGVVGIVAARLQRHFGVPVVLLAINDDGAAQGSGRSTPDFDLAAALAACDTHLIKHGGHAAAAGLTLDTSAIPAFRDALLEIAQQARQDPPIETIDIDAQVALSEIDGRLLRTMDQLEPFGHGHPAPVFCTFGAEIAPRSLRELRGGHLRFTARHAGTALTAIGFNFTARFDSMHDIPSHVDIAFSPQFNTWNGNTTIQLVLKDIRPAT